MKVNIVQNTKGEILAVFNSESPVTPEVVSAYLGYTTDEFTISSHQVNDPSRYPWIIYTKPRSIQDPLQ